MFFMDFWTYRDMFMLIIMCHNAHMDCTVRVNGKRASVRHVHCLHVRLPVKTFCSCCGCGEDDSERTSIGLQTACAYLKLIKKKTVKKTAIAVQRKAASERKF